MKEKPESEALPLDEVKDSVKVEELFDVAKGVTADHAHSEVPPPMDPAVLESPDRQNGMLKVMKVYKKRGVEVNEVVENEMIEVGRFGVETARVMYAAGVTVNIGNYESVKCDISVTLPTYVEELEDAFVVAKTFAHDRLGLEVDEIKKMVKKG